MRDQELRRIYERNIKPSPLLRILITNKEEKELSNDLKELDLLCKEIEKKFGWEENSNSASK